MWTFFDHFLTFLNLTSVTHVTHTALSASIMEDYYGECRHRLWRLINAYDSTNTSGCPKTLTPTSVTNILAKDRIDTFHNLKNKYIAIGRQEMVSIKVRPIKDQLIIDITTPSVDGSSKMSQNINLPLTLERSRREQMTGPEFHNNLKKLKLLIVMTIFGITVRNAFK